MMKIEALEAALKRMKEHEPTWMANDVVRAYRDTQRTGNEILDINRIDWDVEEIIPTLKDLGTLTAGGARIEGMTIVNAPYHDREDNWERIPAVKLLM